MADTSDRRFAAMVGILVLGIIASHIYTTQHDDLIRNVGKEMLAPRK